MVPDFSHGLSLRLGLYGIVCFLLMTLSEALYGSHVCSRNYYVHSYQMVSRSYTGYQRYTTSCGFIGWSRCGRSRAVTKYHYVSKLVTRQQTSYFCCSGWRQNGQKCDRPICDPSCQNGQCIQPNQCHCASGYSGSKCQYDINECAQTPKPCEQICTNLYGKYSCQCLRGYVAADAQSKRCRNVNECLTNDICKCAVPTSSCNAICTDTIGSYKCSCTTGYKLVANRKVCVDVNECKTGAHDCQHTCVNQLGSFRCACRSGYRLASNNCFDIDECKLSNGGCEQNCINTEGSFKCSCRNGFKLLYDGRRCQDINECVVNKPCDSAHGICYNNLGSYQCSCHSGYELKSDRHNCIDINECRRTNNCQQRCINTDGSFHCRCNAGYVLQVDKTSCADIDECSENLYNCQQECINIMGSYICRCRQGYKLHNNSIHCNALPCSDNPIIVKHGSANCTGNSVDDFCLFHCDVGYQQKGVNMSQCLASQRWTQDETSCNAMQCPAASPPIDGILKLPCVEEYGERCNIGCKPGFLLQGRSYVECGLNENGTTKWNVTKTKCSEISLCKPNPCKHGGVCQIVSQKEYVCHCNGPYFSGEFCQLGVIIRPSYSALQAGIQSDLLKITAKPNKKLEIILVSIPGGVEFTPKAFEITRHTQPHAYFRVLAKKAGAYKIEYMLSGPDRMSFLTPDHSLLIVNKAEEQESLRTIPDESFVKYQCHKYILDKCPSITYVVNVVSSCPWISNGSLGYQSVLINGSKLPLSLAGVNSAVKNPFERAYKADGVLTVYDETLDLFKTGLKQCSKHVGKITCKNHLANSLATSEHKFIIERNLFARAYLRVVSNMTPWWYNIDISYDYEGFHVNNIQSLIIKGQAAEKLALCKGIPKSADKIYSVFTPKTRLMFSLLGMQSSIQNDDPTCIAMDLCSNIHYFSFGGKTRVDLTSGMISIGLTNMKMGLHAIGFLGNEGKKKHCGEKYNYIVKRWSQVCLKTSLWAMVDGSITLNNINVSYIGEMFAQFSDAESVVVTKFGSTQRMLFQGQIWGRINLPIGGNIIGIDISDKKGKAFVEFGGNNSCFECYSKGMHLKLSSRYVSFSHRTDTVTFHLNKSSKNESIFGLYLAYDLNGGQIIGIANGIRLRYKIKASSKLMHVAVNQITKYLERHQNFSQIINATVKLKNRTMEAMASIVDELLSGDSEYRIVYLHHARLRKYCMSFQDLLMAVKDQAKASIMSQTLIESLQAQVQILVRTLKLIWDLQVLPKSIPISENFAGFHARFLGKICFHGFCFEDVDIEIRDVKTTKSDEKNCGKCMAGDGNSEDNIILIGKFKQNKILAGFIKIQKGSSLAASLPRKSNLFLIYLPIQINIFDKTYQTNLTINNTMFVSDRIDIEIATNIWIHGHLQAENNYRTKWEDLYFRLIGYSKSPSQLTKIIDAKIAKYIEDTASSTAGRFSKIKSRINTAQSNVYVKGNISTTKYQLFLSSKIHHRDAKADYIKSVVNYNRTHKRFQAQRVSYYFKNLERELNNACKFKQCKMTCVPVPVCSSCQDKVSVDVNTMKCKQISKQQKVTVTEPFETKCQVTIYYVEEIYTGNCHAPGKRTRVDPLQEFLEFKDSGATTESYFGTAVARIGRFVGGVIGLFVSLFGGCDDTWEEILRHKNAQVPCQKERTYVATKHWKETSCSRSVVSVQSGYSLPRRCNCIGHCTNVEDPVCLHYNSECRIKRQYKIREQLERANASANIFSDLQQADVKVQSSFLLLQRANVDLQGARRDYEMSLSSKNRALQGQDLATKSLENMNTKMVLDRCVMEIKGQRSLNTSMVSFNSQSLSADRILFDVILETESKLPEYHSKEVINSFIFSLDDPDISLILGAKAIVKNTFCASKSRHRRSFEESINDTVYGDNVLLSRQNLGSTQSSCIGSEIWFSFLRNAFEKFNTVIYMVELERDLVKNSTRTLGEIIKNQPEKKTNDSILIEELKLLLVLKKFIHQSNFTSRNYVREKWLNDMEVITAANNFTNCYGFKDCTEQAFQYLTELPSLLRTSRYIFLKSVNKTSLTFERFFNANNDEEPLPSLSKRASKELNELKDQTLFCSQPPKVKIFPSFQLKVTVGSSVTLQCIAESNFTLKFSWKKNNKTLIGQIRQSLTFNAHMSSEGSYTCEALDRAGNNKSEECYITVTRPPYVIKHPRSVKYYSSISNQNKPSILCNISGDPDVNITWYFESFANPNEKVSLFYHLPVFHVNNTSKQHGGFYYCVGENEAGKVETNKARLDILSSTIADQGTSLCFMTYDNNTVLIYDSSTLHKVMKKHGLYGTVLINASRIHSEGNKFKVDITAIEHLSTSKQSENLTDKDIVKTVYRTRRAMGNVFSELIVNLTKNANTSEVDLLTETASLSFMDKVCPVGYQLGTNGVTCLECEIGSYEKDGKCILCPRNNHQSNTGQSVCKACKRGHMTVSDGATSESLCVDIDECLVNNGGCHKYADCINLIGSFECNCKNGFSGNGSFCEDINECNQHLCNQQCVNTIGSFKCACDYGYRLFNSTTCVERCSRHIDLVVILDCSGSIGPWNWQRQLSFVRSLVQNFTISQNQTRIGLVVFDEKVKVYVNITTDGWSEDQILSALSNITYLWEPYVRTYTDIALNKAVQMIEEFRKNIPRSVLLLTDGETSFPRKPFLKKPLEILESSSVEIFCVGVGSRINVQELLYISKREDRVFMIKNYKELIKHINNISTKLCESK